MRLVAAVAAAGALLLAFPEPGWVAARRLEVESRPWRVRGGWLLAGLGVALAVAAVRAPLIILGAAAALLGATIARQVRADRARARRMAAVVDSAELADLLASQLRAGALPAHALRSAAVDHPVLGGVSAVVAAGGDVASALRAVGSEPGRTALADVAAAWHVAERVGAPLADSLERVAAAARDDAELQREVVANVAPARATAKLMAVLPLFGLALGGGMGADPVEVITSSVLGALSVAAGALLAAAGVVWIDRIADGADA